MIPVPMSVELGPYGPPNPSGTDQMTRLRRMPPRVRDLPQEASKERESEGELEEANRGRKERGIRAHGLAPEVEPGREPIRLTLRCVGDHPGERLRHSGLKLKRAVDPPNDAEDDADRSLQSADMPDEPVVH